MGPDQGRAPSVTFVPLAMNCDELKCLISNHTKKSVILQIVILCDVCNKNSEIHILQFVIFGPKQCFPLMSCAPLEIIVPHLCRESKKKLDAGM